jgi:hypothetical protein
MARRLRGTAMARRPRGTAMGRLLPVTDMGRLLPVTVMARLVRTIAATRVVDEGTTGPADSELGTDASPAGLYRMASASPIGAISQFAFRPDSTT